MCEQWTKDDFLKFREDQSLALEPRTVLKTLSPCFSQMDSLGLKTCFSNMLQMSLVETLPSYTHKFRFVTPDAKFVEKQASPLIIPPEILEAMPLDDVPWNLEKLIEQGKIDSIEPARLRPFAKAVANKGWKFINYTSQSFGNPSQDPIRSFRRLLVYIPGDSGKMDSFLQFTLPRGSERQYLVDAIGIQRPEDAVAEAGAGARPRIAFNQFWRIYPKNNSDKFRIVQKSLFDFDQFDEVAGPSFGHTYSLDTCTTCHSNGLRKVYPAELNPLSQVEERYALNSETTPIYMNRLKNMNLVIQKYGRTDMKRSDIVDFKDFGPPMGLGGGDFLNTCFTEEGIAEDRRAALVSASQCSTCHNHNSNSLANPITKNFTRGDGGGLKLKILVDKSMPPGKFNAETASYSPLDLAESERNAIYNCLVKHQDQSIKDWLKQGSCL